MDGLFTTKLFQKYLGKGENGGGSKIFKHFELRPWISNAVGVFIALTFGLTAIEAGLGTEFVKTSLIETDGKIVDAVLTGLIIGGGTKRIKMLMKELQNVKKGV